MSSSDLRKQLECAICLNIYTDPVTLKCGHNFCQDCIGRVLDTQEESGGYSCPECREEFQERPAMWKNITLCNIVENFPSAHPDREESGVFCTHCIHTPVPAVKSCLHCEASLCDNHLRVHSKSPEHVLCDPTTSLEGRKCSVHKELLRYYCIEDSTCICVSCSLVGEHRGHQVETLEEASEMKKKKLRNVLQKLMTEREEMEKRIQSLQEHGRKVQEKADDETKRVAALFRDLNRCLEDLEKRVLSEISGQVERLSLSMSDMIQQLEIKKEELSRKMRDIEELCNITDPLTVLQESDTGDLCDTEDGDDEDRERHEKHLHVRGDLDVAGISHTIHTGLSDIMSGVNVHICTGIHVSPHSTTEYEGHIKEEPSSPPSIQCSDHQAGGPNIVVVQQTWGVSGVTDILPEVKTAGNQLHLSDDGKTVSGTSHQTLLETSGRFWSSQKSNTGDLCDTEGGDDEKLLHDGGDLDVVGISHTLHTGLFDIMSGVNVQECTGTHVSPHSTTKDEGIINAEPSRKRLRFTPTIQHSHMEDIGPNIGVVQQTLGVSEVTDMLLDVRTAGNYLLISDDGKTASSSSHQNLPETPERFQCPQVISSQIFSSGRHYWEVDVGGSIYWKVGMCYPSIDRRGVQSWIGFNRKSWGLERLWGDEYLVIHDRKETPLPGRVSSNRVRIDLDYEAGRISFYELCDPIRHLHTFTTTFTEPLQAGLGVWKGFIKISGGIKCETNAQRLVTSQGGEPDWCNTPIRGQEPAQLIYL